MRTVGGWPDLFDFGASTAPATRPASSIPSASRPGPDGALLVADTGSHRIVTVDLADGSAGVWLVTRYRRGFGLRRSVRI